MLRAYSGNALLHGDWLLGDDGGDGGGDGGGDSGGSGMPSLSDVGGALSKGASLLKQGQSALNTVTGGGTKTAGAKGSVTTDIYFRCKNLKGLALSQCKHDVDRAAKLRDIARKKTPSGGTKQYLVIGLGLVAVGGLAWVLLA